MAAQSPRKKPKQATCHRNDYYYDYYYYYYGVDDYDYYYYYYYYYYDTGSKMAAAAMAVATIQVHSPSRMRCGNACCGPLEAPWWRQDGASKARLRQQRPQSRKEHPRVNSLSTQLGHSHPCRRWDPGTRGGRLPAQCGK